MLEVTALDLPEVLEITARRFSDERGFFTESWNAGTWRDAGIELAFVQDNHSLSRERGVLRGLHYQIDPMAQQKLVRVTRGSIFDVAVDIRRSSPNFGRWVGRTISANRGNQLLIPTGFAHGFVTIERNTEVQYKVSAPYSVKHERAIRFDDPQIAVQWPVDTKDLILSTKDSAAPLLSELDVASLPE